MSEPQTRRPKVRNHELLIMSKLCELYSLLKPERRVKVHEHIGGLLDDLPTIAQVQPSDEEAPPLPLHARIDGEADAARAAP